MQVCLSCLPYIAILEIERWNEIIANLCQQKDEGWREGSFAHEGGKYEKVDNYFAYAEKKADRRQYCGAF